MPSTPTLATIKGVEIASVGYWNISNAEDWHPSAEDLAAAVAALDCPAVRRPCLKFGHTGQPGEGDPSIGLVDGLRLADDGQTLLGDFVGVPAWMAAADGEGRSVIASAYPDRSGEFQRDYVCQLGHNHPFVVHALALLGVERPGIGTLESLYDLYTKAPEKETVMANAAVALAAGTSIDDVRRAYYDGPGSNWYLWIREMFIDPAELIVQNDEDDTLQRVSYTITGDGQVEFGDGQAVKVEYVNARAASEKPALVFASRAEARTTPQSPSAAQAEVNKGKEGPVPTTLKEGLAQKLGIAADADDETALRALDEALAERAEPSTDAAPTAAEPSAEQLVAAAAKAGMVLVDGKQWETTVAAAKQGAEAYAKQVSDGDQALVEAAIRDGKFPPAQRDHYLGLLGVDRARTTTLIDQMAKGFIPVAEAGHAISPGESVVPDDLSWFDTAPTEPTTDREDS